MAGFAYSQKTRKTFEKVIGDWLAGKDGSTRVNSQGRAYLVARGSRLLSYEHYPLAVRLNNGDILINADKPPTKSTNVQLNVLLSVVPRRLAKYVPFSALRRIGLNHVESSTVQPIASTDPKEIERVNRKGEKYQEHFLGELVFRVAHLGSYQYYVCGLDRNEPVKRRLFFLSQLPGKAKPSSVDDALDRLRPKRVSKDALRQGEWFFEKTDKKFDKTRVLKRTPIIEDKPAIYSALYVVGARAGRHVATRMAFHGGKVYVSGCVRDRQHDRLKLGNGKDWYLVSKNTAASSWGAQGDVD